MIYEIASETLINKTLVCNYGNNYLQGNKACFVHTTCDL